jgi:hypothetical protein
MVFAAAADGDGREHPGWAMMTAAAQPVLARHTVEKEPELA